VRTAAACEGAVIPLSKVTREHWLKVGLGVLADDGRSPAELSVADLAGRLGVSRGSFYSYWRGLADFHPDLISRWLNDRTSGMPHNTVREMRDLLDRLRLLRINAAENARADGAMRRWAVTEPAAKEAVEEVDRSMAAQLQEALRNLGFAGDEAEVLGSLVAAAFAGGEDTALAPGHPAAFEILLGILERAASVTPEDLVLYTIARRLPPAARADLAARAQQFDAGQLTPAEPGLPAANAG
jgi:AcrR family transcriptional regulator